MRILGIFILMLSVSACVGRTPDTDYFVLQSGLSLSPVDAIDKNMPCVQVRRVDIPGYLNRDAIVTRGQSGVRLTLPNFRAWAEPLGSGMQRVLAESLIQPLLAQGVLLQALDDEGPAALQLSVQVYRFDGVLGGQVRLEARWTLRDTKERILARGLVAESESAGHDYESLVLAQSVLVRRMGEKIAAPLAVAAKKGKH